MQLARVGVRVLVLVDAVCVMLVLIARVDVVHAVDTVFVSIFCSWRSTLYNVEREALERYSRHGLPWERNMACSVGFNRGLTVDSTT